MKTIRLIQASLLLALFGHAVPGLAEDIDLYSSNTGAASYPNILIILDNSANWAAENQDWLPQGTTQGEAELNALRTIANELSGVNLGLMMFTPGSGGANQDGGYVRFHIRPMDNDATGKGPTNKKALSELIGTSTCGGGNIGLTNSLNLTPNCIYKNFQTPAEKVNSANVNYSAAMFEAFKYFGGYTNPANANTDIAGSPISASQYGALRYGGNPDAKTDRFAFTNSGSDRTNYIVTKEDGSPFISSCAKNYIVFISNGEPGKDSAVSLLRGVGGDTVLIPNANAKARDNYADEWARFLKQTDCSSATGKQNVKTYTIDVYKAAQDLDATALLKSMASAGGGKYFVAQNEEAILDALRRIVLEVQAVNSVFSSSSLPVSVNAQGTFLNQIYMGMFRPNEEANPRWLGNLKQYQFAYDASDRTLMLADSLGYDAISSAGTGFITPTAVSFWTCTNATRSAALGAPYNTRPICSTDPTSGFWVIQPNSAGGAFDLQDGELVEKGGAAQILRLANLSNVYTDRPGTTDTTVTTVTRNPRKLLTYCPSGTGCGPSGTPLSASLFDSSNLAITDALLKTADAPSTTRDRLIRWVRGHDYKNAELVNNQDQELGPGSPINIRPSVHGDVLHSRPVVLNYGGTTGVVVFYGGNDGVFRAVNGNQTGTGAGSELWGFIPSEFYGKLKRLHDNSPVMLLPGVTMTFNPPAQRKDYFVDGSTGIYQLLDADGKTLKAHLYLAMRRGGRLLYALDVTDPANPKFLWKKSNTDSGFSELGQTWSQPKVVFVKGHTNPVLIFGAGYDAAAQGAEPPKPDTMGRGIFVLDAITGALVWSAQPSCSAPCLTVPGMNYSIPADITLMDRDRDGKIDRLYATDVGGNVWRVDTERAFSGTPDTWGVTKLAALGCDSGTCAANITPRKFFYPPEVITTTKYDAVFAGSGDREHPLYADPAEFPQAAYSVTNRLYMLKDLNNTSKDATTIFQPTITEAALFDATIKVYDNTLSGYYLTLCNTKDSPSKPTTCPTGEKVVNAPTVTAGYVYFATNQPQVPSPNSCPTLGTARGYSVNPFTGVYTSIEYEGGGLPPTAVSGVVNIVNADGTTTPVPFCIGCGGNTECVGSGCTSAVGGARPAIDVSTSRKRTYWYIENK